MRRGIWRPPEPETPEEVIAEGRDPTFHAFASEWFEREKHGWSKRTREDYWWALTLHLLPFFARHRLSTITASEVDRYRAHKLREGRLGNNSINKTLTRLGQVLEYAVPDHLATNPAVGKRRRCKTTKPARASMGAEQVAALLEAAGKHRAMLATAIMGGGLRVSEVTGLRWRDVDLASCVLRVVDSKTEAGVREVELDPALRDELAAHKASSKFTQPDHYVFPGRHKRRRPDGVTWDGYKRRDRNAPRTRALYPAIKRANVLLEERGVPTIPDGTDGRPRVTFHSLRRTYASLAYEANLDPVWTRTQIGHSSARFTMEVYADAENRKRGLAARVGDLVRSSEWAATGRNGSGEDLPPPPSPSIRL